MASDPLQGLTVANRERIYADLRVRAPVYWSTVHHAWVLTRYADVVAILRHPDALAIQPVPVITEIHRRGGPDLHDLAGFCASMSLLTRPPRHDDVRRLLSVAMAGIRDLNLPESLERKATELLDRGEQEGSINLADGY